MGPGGKGSSKRGKVRIIKDTTPWVNKVWTINFWFYPSIKPSILSYTSEEWYDVFTISSGTYNSVEGSDVILQFNGYKFRLCVKNNTSEDYVYTLTSRFGFFTDDWININAYYDYKSSNARLYICINGYNVFNLLISAFNINNIDFDTGEIDGDYEFYYTAIRLIDSKFPEDLGMPTGVNQRAFGFPLYRVRKPPYTTIVTGYNSQTSYNQRNPIFHYPIDSNIEDYSSNDTYDFVKNNVKFFDDIENDTREYIVPLIGTLDLEDEVNIDLIENHNYKLPLSYTIEFWVYVSETYNLKKEYDINLFSSQSFLRLLLGTNGFHVLIHKADSTNDYQTGKQIELGKKAWNHIALVYNGTNMTIYANGKKYDTVSKAIAPYIPSRVYLMLQEIACKDNDNYITNIHMDRNVRYTKDFDHITQSYSGPPYKIGDDEPTTPVEYSPYTEDNNTLFLIPSNNPDSSDVTEFKYTKTLGKKLGVGEFALHKMNKNSFALDVDLVKSIKESVWNNYSAIGPKSGIGGDYVFYANNATSMSFTIETLYYLKDTGSTPSDSSIQHSVFAVLGTNSYFELLLSKDSSNSIAKYSFIDQSSVENTRSQNLNVSIGANTWIHCAVTYNNNTKVLIYYVNGTEVFRLSNFNMVFSFGIIDLNADTTYEKYITNFRISNKIRYTGNFDVNTVKDPYT